MLCVLGNSSNKSFPDLGEQRTRDCKKFGPPLSDVHEEGITGSGIKIAIIDTFDVRFPNDGTMKRHMAFKNAKLTIINKTTARDKNKREDHALKCTAIIVGQSFKGHFLSADRFPIESSYPGGVAPKADATLYLVNHRDEKHESLNAAFKEVAEGCFDVLSLSFGNYAEWMKKPIKEILKHNTIVVAAAGNDGNWTGVTNPALVKGVISVGSLNTRLMVSETSPTGEKVDIHFYGEIMVPVSDDDAGDTLMFSKGSSMAAPGIVGMICLLLQCAKKHGYGILNKEVLLEILKKLITTDDGVYAHPDQKSLIKAYNNKEEFDKLW